MSQSKNSKTFIETFKYLLQNSFPGFYHAMIDGSGIIQKLFSHHGHKDSKKTFRNFLDLIP